MTSLGVYVHIPYCRTKCPYCNFVAVRARGGEEGPYVEALLAEVAAAAAGPDGGRPAATVYLGGGTPSLFHPRAIARVLEAIDRAFPIEAGAEVTLEADPATVDREGLAALRAAGVTRLSIGLQAFDGRALGALGRAHKAEDGPRLLADARAAGFDTVSVDLIFGVPGQTLSDWAAEVARAVDAAPAHISCYGLTVEPGTPFAALEARGRLARPDDALQADMFLLADERLRAAGYEHYEVSNYARPGARARHNAAYWNRRPYRGFGAGAHSFEPAAGPYGTRAWNVDDPALYVAAATGRAAAPAATPDAPARAGGEVLGRDEARMEALLLGLRQADGLDLEDYARLVGEPIERHAAAALGDLESRGLVTRRDGRLRVASPAAWLLCDEIVARLA
ncbi:MAG TPA: radical SAM family heme chaperone HemW [Thermodesulfobacteriota bacterium]